MSLDGVDPPSSISQSTPKFDRAQSSDTSVSVGFRPREDFGPLPALFCPPFAYGHNRIQQLSSVLIDEEARLNRWLRYFADYCGSINRGEKDLVALLHAHLETFIGDYLKQHATFCDLIGAAFELDLSATCKTAHGLEVVYFIFEFKNSPFSGGFPLVQAIHAYQRMIAMKKVRTMMTRLRLRLRLRSAPPECEPPRYDLLSLHHHDRRRH